MRVVGIDLGSSSIKAAVLDLDRQTIEGVVQVPFCAPLTGLPPLHVEIDPNAIVGQVENVLRRILDGAPDCQAVFSCAQMRGLVLVDENRNACSNYLSWQDQRVLGGLSAGENHQDRLRARLTEPLIRRLGNELRPGGAIGLLSWLAEHRLLPPGQVTAMSLGDYVMMRLCHAEPMAHPTTAPGTLDLTRREFSYEMLERLNLSNVRWPQLVDLTRPIGMWWIGGRKLNCFAAVGDQQCALFGANLRERELSINISTGSQVSLRTSDLRFGPSYQTQPYFSDGWLNTITHLPAGRALNVLVDLLTELAPSSSAITRDQIWNQILQAVRCTPPTDLAVNLAFFAGPAGNSGSISNITLQNLTIGNLFRAAFANMVDNYHDAARALNAGENCDRLVLSGGLAQKLTGLSESLAARLQLPHRIATGTEETLQGLLELGRASCVDGIKPCTVHR